jgi:hypothetical protein
MAYVGWQAYAPPRKILEEYQHLKRRKYKNIDTK